MIDLEHMVVEGMIQPEKEIEWKSCLSQPFPSEAQEEIMLFKSFCERGFALPASDFFRELLQFYGLELHHLTPNGVSYIANFQHFFEAFLGIEPSLPFFRYLFHVKGQPNNQNPRVVGGAGIQLRQGSSVQWFKAVHKNKLDRWETDVTTCRGLPIRPGRPAYGPGRTRPSTRERPGA